MYSVCRREIRADSVSNIIPVVRVRLHNERTECYRPSLGTREKPRWRRRRSPGRNSAVGEAREEGNEGGSRGGLWRHAWTLISRACDSYAVNERAQGETSSLLRVRTPVHVQRVYILFGCVCDYVRVFLFEPWGEKPVSKFQLCRNSCLELFTGASRGVSGAKRCQAQSILLRTLLDYFSFPPEDTHPNDEVTPSNEPKQRESDYAPRSYQPAPTVRATE